MRRYKILISGKAQEDMEAVYEYIAMKLLAPAAAVNQYNRIANAILTLEEMPERIKIMDSEPEHSQRLRRLIVDHYSVFFVIRSDTVYIVRVLYGSSDIGKRLSDNQ
jgi:plasmid stabilization system protein ParE